MAGREKHPILIVDDEADILFSVKALLRRDFEVYTAQSGAEALKILAERPVHVIMSDQRMPEMTGVELLHRAQAECPEAVRIVFTGYADIKAVVDAVNRAHIFHYLAKPWDPDDLPGLLHKACAEYQRIADETRLRADMKQFLEEYVAQPAAGGAPCQGPAKPEFVEAGQSLLARLQALRAAEQPGQPQAESPRPRSEVARLRRRPTLS